MKSARNCLLIRFHPVMTLDPFPLTTAFRFRSGADITHHILYRPAVFKRVFLKGGKLTDKTSFGFIQVPIKIIFQNQPHFAHVGT